MLHIHIGQIFRPDFYNGTFTTVRHLEFFTNILEEFLGNLNLADSLRVFYLQEGVPPPNNSIINNFSNCFFNDRVTRGPVRRAFSAYYTHGFILLGIFDDLGDQESTTISMISR